MSCSINIQALEYSFDGEKPKSNRSFVMNFVHEKKSLFVGDQKFKLEFADIKYENTNKMRIKGDGINMLININKELWNMFESTKKGIQYVMKESNENTKNFSANLQSQYLPHHSGSTQKCNRLPLQDSSSNSSASESIKAGSVPSLGSLLDQRSSNTISNSSKTPVKSALTSHTPLSKTHISNDMMSGRKQGSASRPPVAVRVEDQETSEGELEVEHVPSPYFKPMSSSTTTSKAHQGTEVDDIVEFDEVPYASSRAPSYPAVTTTSASFLDSTSKSTTNTLVKKTYGRGIPASSSGYRTVTDVSLNWTDTGNDSSLTSPHPRKSGSFADTFAKSIPNEHRQAQLKDLASAEKDDKQSAVKNKLTTTARPSSNTSRAGHNKSTTFKGPSSGNTAVNDHKKLKFSTAAPMRSNLSQYLVPSGYSSTLNRSYQSFQSVFRPSSLTQSSKGALEGLRNLGNTCYMNAVVQALIGLRALTNDLGSVFWTTLYSQTRVTAADAIGTVVNEVDRKSCFVQLVNIVNALSNSSHGVIDMRLMKAAVDAQSDRFYGSAQQDAHEFLIDLINVLHEDMEGRLKRFLFDSAKLNGISHLLLKNDSESLEKSVPIENISSSSSSKGNKTDTRQLLSFPLSPQLLYLLPTVRHLHSCLTLQMQCTSCGLRKDPRLEYYRDFSLDFDFDYEVTVDGHAESSTVCAAGSGSGSSSRGSFGSFGQRQRVFKVEDLLKRFFAAENRDLHCDSCRIKGAQTTVTAQISLLPHVLVLHLKRFKYNSASNSFQKVSNKVLFQKHLDLRPFCSDDCEATPSGDDVMTEGGLDRPCGTAFDLGEEVQRVRRQLDGSLDGKDESTHSVASDDHAEEEYTEQSGQEASETDMVYNYEANESRQDSNETPTNFVELLAQHSTSPQLHNSLTSPSSSKKKRLYESTSDGTMLESLGTRYTLSAVVRHLGSDAFAGHYICDTLVPHSIESGKVHTGNQWRRCNDSHVAPILESEVLAEQESPYILFYTRQS